MFKGKKFLILFLGIFLLVFCYEGREIYNELSNEYNTINWEEDGKIEYDKLTEEEKNKYESFDDFIEERKEDSFKFAVISGISITLVLTFVRHYILWFLSIGLYLGMKKYYKTKLSKNDFNKNIGYYRDILREYSADLLGYIDNMELKIPDVLVAMLLQLKLKGIINIENNKIYFNDNIDINMLSNNERYLINKVHNNKVVINNINEYKNLVIKEGLIKELLEEKEYTKKHLEKDLRREGSIYVIVIILYNLFWKFFPDSFYIGDNYWVILLMIIIVFGPFIYFFGYPIYIFSKYAPFYIKSNINPYFRTKKAEDINKKLEGLKSFLKDFSKLDEREAKEIILWDEYLIYSVLFGHNDKIIDEYKELIVI